VLDGKPVVFLSCSEKFKLNVAFPVRSALTDIRIHGVIVTEGPSLPRTDWGPDDKVDSYLNASDAFVALCTPDNQNADGTIECRQNIIDEIQRARNKPHLRSRLMILKTDEVELPSNINPTYEQLDAQVMGPSIALIVRQLRT
jgi:predicted nucleotide-binding protein